jgi:hypothetical protein
MADSNVTLLQVSHDAGCEQFRHGNGAAEERALLRYAKNGAGAEEK